MLLIAGTMAQAMNVNFYIDTAPNASAAYAAWKTDAYAAAAAGTYVNMRSGAHPGTNLFDPLESIVYSTGDLGHFVQWVFWIPDKTVTDLTGNIQYRYTYNWDGTEATTTWRTTVPSMINYGTGVVGTFGCANWAVDDSAAPFDTGGTPYDETDAADIATVAAQMVACNGYSAAELQVRDSSESAWQSQTLTGYVATPEPTSIMALLVGIGSIAGYRRFRK